MKHATRGFTLIELMTAILVLGILFAVALPNFREMTRSNRIAGAQNDLVTALALARSEALHRSTTVSVCASTDSTTCSGGTDWTTGWIAFTDTGTAGTVDGTDEVLQKWGVMAGETKLTGPASGYLRYATTGMLAPEFAGTQSLIVFYTGCVGAKARLVTVTPVGLLTATKSNCP